MSLTPGTRLGPYEVVAPIGAGGMGEVYRAHDSKLNRDVALKILPDLFAADVDRLARFKREAQVLASLNHPNIGHIYGFEDGTSPHALVLELIEGPTLADRIAQGAIPIDEALPIAKQIADALEAAHDHGIVHRDLKPANIKVNDDGAVKVLDFGLAKALDPTASRSSEAALNSPTLTAPTQMGVILGTAAYMAPEQAKGKTVDRRADIWAFGAVLYEMLTGTRAFQGDDVSDTLAAVLRQQVDWSALPASTPAAVRHLIVRCLERDGKRRLRDIGEARIVLEDPATREDTREARIPVAAATIASTRPMWRRALPAVLSAIIVGTIVAAVAWYLRPSPSLAVVRFPLPLGEGQTFPGSRQHLLDISPDGKQILLALNNRLYLRSMSALDIRPIPGTDAFAGTLDPRFAPDGESIVFWAVSDRTLKRMPLTGGAAITIGATDAPWGLSWDDNGITLGQGEKGIVRISADGGTPETIVTVKAGEFVHGPQLLPGGQHVLYTLATGAATDRWDKARIVVQALPSGEAKTVIEGGSDARYLPTGHLVYAQGGILFAAPFDLKTLAVTRGAVTVVEGVGRAIIGTTGAAQFSVSNNGSLVYRPGPATFTFGTSTLVIADKQGNLESLKLPPGAYEYPRASPDGTRIAFGTSDGREAVIWIFDITGGTAMRRLTFGGNNRFPVWSRDGKRVAFQSDREGDLGIFWQPADGSTSTAERLTKASQGEAHVPQSWSPTADVLLFDVTKGSDTSLWMFSSADGKAVPFGAVQTRVPTSAIFSPDGRWVAYVAPASTALSFTGVTVFVEPFPRTEAKYQLTSKPGESPHEMTWSPDGKQLYYNPRPGGFEAVSINAAPTFAFGNPVAVPRPFLLGPPIARRAYDMMPDGRFVGLLGAGQSGLFSGFQGIHVVLNWFEELKARVPKSNE